MQESEGRTDGQMIRRECLQLRVEQLRGGVDGRGVERKDYIRAEAVVGHENKCPTTCTLQLSSCNMKVARLKKLNSRIVNGNINSVNPTLLKSVKPEFSLFLQFHAMEKNKTKQ